jgi:transposase
MRQELKQRVPSQICRHLMHSPAPECLATTLELINMNILADTTDIVIGIDPHKHTHTAAIVAAATGKILTSCTVQARPSGFSQLLRTAAKFSGTRCWVIEGCGSWGRGFATWLMANDEIVREIDSPRRPVRRMGKKNDDIDAIRAAREALGREMLAEPRCTGDRDALAALLVARRSAVQMATDTERQLLALVSTCPEALAERLRGHKTYRIVTICSRWRPKGHNAIVATAGAMRIMARRAKYLRAEAKTHEAKIDDLVRSWRPDLLNLLGVGPIIAATALTVWSHPGRVRSEAAFAMLSGVAPIPASSGLVTRHRLNRRGDRHLNSALHIVTIQRQRYDPRTQAYFERRRAEGKSDREIRRCLKRYVAREIFRVLEQPLDTQ